MALLCEFKSATMIKSVYLECAHNNDTRNPWSFSTKIGMVKIRLVIPKLYNKEINGKFETNYNTQGLYNYCIYDSKLTRFIIDILV